MAFMNLKTVAEQLAAQTNQQYAVRQAQQFGHEPYFQTEGPDSEPIVGGTPQPQPTYQPPPDPPLSESGGEAPSGTTQPVGAPITQNTSGPVQTYVPQSTWNTDGYATPQYTANRTGSALSGWDPTKWSDPNHQTPKYVIGGILSNYNTADPSQRSLAIEDILRAYPGTTYDGNDTITMPWGGAPIDIFRGADAGIWAPQYMPIEGEGAPEGVSPLAMQLAGAGSGMTAPSIATGGGIPAPQVSQGGGGAYDVAMQLLQQLQSQGDMDMTGEKERQKELLTQLRADQLQGLEEDMARRGVSGGYYFSKLGDINDSFNSALTGSYRDLDQQAQEQEFQRLLAALGAAQGLAGLDLQGELGRGDLDVRRQGLNVQRDLGFGDLDLRRAQLEQQGSQFNRSFGLSTAEAQQRAQQNYWNTILGLF